MVQQPLSCGRKYHSKAGTPLLHHAPQSSRHSGIFLALSDKNFRKLAASVPASSLEASLCLGSTRSL